MGTNLSTARLKTVTTLGPAFVVAVAPFPALAPGKFDNFCFDFTAEAGATSIAATTWTASFDPGNTSASDTNPPGSRDHRVSDNIDLRAITDRVPAAGMGRSVFRR